ATGRKLVEMAGYRNRLVHFYGEPTPRELFEICAGRREDIETVVDEVLAWLRQHPERLDNSL
ncbi:MAG: HepT-like ribonuclease domain-containing protein, partial [Acidobacteriota bacterium]